MIFIKLAAFNLCVYANVNRHLSVTSVPVDELNSAKATNASHLFCIKKQFSRVIKN